MVFKDPIVYLVTQEVGFPISNVTKSNLQQKLGFKEI